MEQAQAGRVIVSCPECGCGLRLPAEKTGGLYCPKCSHWIEVSTQRRKLPGFLVSTTVVALWSITVLPQKGLPHSVEICFAASLLAYLILRAVHKAFHSRLIDQKVIVDVKTLFLIMLIVATPFAIASIALNWLASPILSYVTVSALLCIQHALDSPWIEPTLISIASIGGVSMAVLAILLWLRDLRVIAERVARARKSFLKSAKFVAFALLAFGNFSILTWVNGGTLIQLSQEAAAKARVELDESLLKLLASVRIVWGERLALEYLADQKLGEPASRTPVPLTKNLQECEDLTRTDDHACDLAALFGRALWLERELLNYEKNNWTSQDGGKRTGPLAPTGSPLTKLVEAYVSAARDARTQRQSSESDHPAVRRARDLVRDTKLYQIHESASAACRATSCDRLRKSEKTIEGVTRLVVEMTLGSLEAFAPTVPFSESFESLGKVWTEFGKAVTTSPAKAAIEDYLVRMVRRTVERRGALGGFEPAPAQVAGALARIEPLGQEVVRELRRHVDRTAQEIEQLELSEYGIRSIALSETRAVPYSHPMARRLSSIRFPKHVAEALATNVLANRRSIIVTPGVSNQAWKVTLTVRYIQPRSEPAPGVTPVVWCSPDGFTGIEVGVGNVMPTDAHGKTDIVLTIDAAPTPALVGVELCFVTAIGQVYVITIRAP